MIDVDQSNRPHDRYKQEYTNEKLTRDNAFAVVESIVMKYIMTNSLIRSHSDALRFGAVYSISWFP